MLYIVTHNDLDGVASAAIYLSLARKRFNGVRAEIHFVEPANILNLLRKSLRVEQGSLLAFMDLGMNESILPDLKAHLASLSSNKVTIEWYDHHVWSREWVDALSGAGARVIVDGSTCGAGVVYKHSFPGVEREECHPLIVDGVCGADLWLWDDPISPLLYRATRMPRGRKGDAFRRYLIEELASCRLISDDLIEKALWNLESELAGYKMLLKDVRVLHINSDRVGILYRELDHPGISLSANYLISKKELDLAVVIKPDGSVSFRSRKGIARKYALCFGGGGHPNASGGRVSLPIFHRLISSIPFLRKRILIREVEKRLSRCA